METVSSVVAPPAQLPDWETHFFEIASEPEYLQSQEELEELAATMTDDQVRDALEQLKAEKSGAALVFGRALAHRWTEKSPELAAQWTATLSDNEFAHVICKEVVNAWAAKDLNAVAGWVQQLPEGGNKTAAELSLVLETASQKDGATAVSILASLPAEPARDDLLNYSLRQWASVDVDNAAAWTTQISDSSLRERILDNIATGLGDPFSAATFAATKLAAGAGRDNAVVNIIQFWAASAPQDAAGWLSQFPEGPLRETATKSLFEVWGKSDPAAAEAWGQTVQQQ